MDNSLIERTAGAAIAATNGAISEATVSQFIAFLDVRPRTLETYKKALKQFFLYIGARGISEPTRETIISYRDGLTAAGRAASTVQLYLIAVKQFFKWTAQAGLYPNIAENVKGKTQAAGFKKDYLSAEAVRAILSDIDRSTCKGARDYAIISLMVTTGLRTIEVARANIEDLRTCGADTVLYIQGKGHDEKDAYVKIEPHVNAALRYYFKARARCGEVAGDAPLFASESNRHTAGRMTTRSISRIAKAAMQSAGYNSDRLTAHSLRHTAATLNILNGGSLEETKQLLRHQSLNTTLIYNNALERAKNNSEGRIGAAIWG